MMINRHKDNTEKKNIELKNKFIREQIKPDRKQIAKSLLKKVGITALLALFFGAVAGTTFYMIEDVIKLKLPFLSNDNITSVQTSSVTNADNYLRTAEVATQSATSELTKKDISTLENFDNIGRKLAAIGQKCNKSIVTVISKKSGQEWLDDAQGKNKFCGTIFSESSSYLYILVNSADVNDDDIKIMFSNNEEVAISDIKTDNRLKFSIISVKKSNIPKSSLASIEPITIADDSSMSLGENVIALGAPNGVIYSVETGSIVNNSITAYVTDNELTLYCTDVLYSESARGIMTDVKGNVVGIISNLYTDVTGDTGCAFIPLDEIRASINNLVSGNIDVYCGIKGMDISSEKASQKNTVVGVYVTDVESESPAYDSGLRVADIITKVGDDSVSNMKEFNSEINKYSSGDSIEITAIRENNDKNTEKKYKVILN